MSGSLKGESIEILYKNLAHEMVTRKQAPASVIVWAAVSADFRSLLAFVGKGVKINASIMHWYTHFSYLFQLAN